MKAATRLTLYGLGLVAAFGAAFGLAGAVVPGTVVVSWIERSEAGRHHEGTGQVNGEEHGAAGAGSHDHAADGGEPPEGIEAATSPTYLIGATVRLAADHMPGMDGSEATISGAFDTTTYSVSYIPTTGVGHVTDHRWVVHEELRSPGEAPVADGTKVVLDAEHMSGMRGAEARIEGSTRETVYMVDVGSDGAAITNHKWVVESEIRPVR